MSNTLFYDNIFTSNLWTGTQNGLNLSNPSSLNSQLWTELSMDRTLNGVPVQKGVFFIAKTFNASDSAIIISAINAKIQNSFYFDLYGNLFIYDGSGNQLLGFNNPLAYGRPFDKLHSTGSIILSKVYNTKLIMSETNTYILSINNNIVKMLYNPIHRTSFKNYYNSCLLNANGNGYNSGADGNDSIQALIGKYCEINAIPGSSNGNRGYSDSSCKCLGLPDVTYNNDVVGECIDDALGQHVTDPSVRNTLGYTCVCAAGSCTDQLTTTGGIGNSSFVTNFKQNIVKASGYNGQCPPIQSVICNLAINAGGSVNTSNAKISQNCGSQLAAAAAATAPVITQRPIPTQATTTQPPVTTQATVTTQPPTTTQATVTTQPPETTQSLYTLLIANIYNILGLAGLLIFFIIFFLKK